MSKKYFSKFQHKWLTDKNYSNWIKKHGTHIAYCTFCKLELQLGTSGKTTLDKHIASRRHKENITVKEIPACFLGSPSGSQERDSTGSRGGSKQLSIEIVLEDRQVWEAEIRWLLKCVCSKYSKRSCDDVGDMFRSMFPDSNIAKRFACARTKCSYGILYGIYPYLESLLMKEISESPWYALSFDESHNKILHFGQMDFHVRYWDNNLKQAKTRYLTSEFLQSATAEDLQQKFDSVVSNLNAEKLIQISSDGPAVNLKFLREMNEKREELDNPPLIDVGTCGLHVVHGSFKTGLVASEWDINKILKWMHALVADCPARRAIYEKITGSNSYPESFSKTRWCENESCAKKAADLWPNYKIFIGHLKGLQKSKQPKNSKSFDGLAAPAVVNDPLLCTKFKFAESCSWKLNSFLRGFQTDSPMIPFLSTILDEVLRWFLEKFILNDTLTRATNVTKLIKIDTQNKDFLKPSKLIDLGFSAKQELQKTKQSSQPPSSSQLQIFYTQARTMLQKFSSHFMEKSPLKMAVVRLAVCFNPVFMANNSESAVIKFGFLLEKLLALKKIQSGSYAESCKSQYKKFIEKTLPSVKDKFLSFDMYKQRLDSFLGPLFDVKDYEGVFTVFQIICIIFHGQAAVERGFNVNKEHLADNLKENSLIALRFINDFMETSGESPATIKISNELIASYKNSRKAYTLALEEKKKQSKSDEQENYKRTIADQIKEVNTKKLKLETSIEKDTKRADELCRDAMIKEDFSFLRMANALKDGINKNKETLNKLNDEEAVLKK